MTIRLAQRDEDIRALRESLHTVRSFNNFP